MSIAGLLDRYVVETKVAAPTEKAWRRILGHLKDFLGHDDAQAVTTDDLIRWKEHLLLEKNSKGEQRSPRTVREPFGADSACAMQAYSGARCSMLTAGRH
jgi:hypothetical protein